MKLYFPDDPIKQEMLEYLFEAYIIYCSESIHPQDERVKELVERIIKEPIMEMLK